MFSRWLWIFIIGVHCIGFIILLLHLIRNREQTFFKFQRPDGQTIKNRKQEKEKRLALKILRVYYYCIMVGGVILGGCGIFYFFIPAVRDIPYVQSQDYLFFEGEIIYIGGTAVTVKNKESGEEKHFRLSTSRPVGSHIKVSYLPHTKLAECRVN